MRDRYNSMIRGLAIDKAIERMRAAAEYELADGRADVREISRDGNERTLSHGTQDHDVVSEALSTDS
jgi:hypothetical protein